MQFKVHFYGFKWGIYTQCVYHCVLPLSVVCSAHTTHISFKQLTPIQNKILDRTGANTENLSLFYYMQALLNPETAKYKVVISRPCCTCIAASCCLDFDWREWSCNCSFLFCFLSLSASADWESRAACLSAITPSSLFWSFSMLDCNNVSSRAINASSLSFSTRTWKMTKNLCT